MELKSCEGCTICILVDPLAKLPSPPLTPFQILWFLSLDRHLCSDTQIVLLAKLDQIVLQEKAATFSFLGSCHTPKVGHACCHITQSLLGPG